MAEKYLTIHPDGSNLSQAREMATDIMEMILQHFSGLEKREVMRSCMELPSVYPPLTWEETVAYLHYVLEVSMQVEHPRFFGHMDSGPLFVSVLADWVTSALNQNLLSSELSPLAVKIEEEVIEWLSEQCGYDRGEGTLVSGGTMANFTALLLSSHQATQGRFRREGVWAFAKRPILFTSDQAHYSLVKAAAGAGLGEHSVVKVPSDEQFRMDVAALEPAIQQALSEGNMPLMVMATVGTTSTGSIDPLPEIAKICKKYSLWLHVDAAHGSGALFSPVARSKLIGLEHADSITIDPHKWLMQPKSMGVILTRHVGLLRTLFEADAPYLQRGLKEVTASLGAMTFQGSRRFDALRLWITRLYLGDRGLADLIDLNLQQVALWQKLLSEHDCFELAHEPDLNLLCFRYVQEHRTDVDLSRLNEEIQQQLRHEGQGFVSITTLLGKRWLRSVFLNPATTEKDMRGVLSEIVRLGEQLGTIA